MLDNMISEHTLLGSFSSDLIKEHPSYEFVQNLHARNHQHQLFVDSHCIIYAPFIIKHDDVVVAANPLTDRDKYALKDFSESWQSGDVDSSLVLVEQCSLSCALLVYSEGDLVLVRDRLGVDDVYYHCSEDICGVSTNLTLLVDAFFPPQSGGGRSPNIDSMFNHFLYGRPRAGASLFHGIHSVEAANFVTINGGVKSGRYWSPLDKPLPLLRREERLKVLEDTLENACLQSFSEEGNAIFLSGGLDSSYISYIAGSQWRKKRGGNIDVSCYTVSYDDPQFDDEAYYANIVSKAYDLPLTKVSLNEENVLHYLKQVLDSPQPLSAWAGICNHALVDAAVNDGYSHILSGLGSDEVLGNYDKMLDYYFRVRDIVKDGGVRAVNLLNYVNELDKILFPGVADFFNPDSLRDILADNHLLDFNIEDLKYFYQSCGGVDKDSHLFSFMVSHECHHRIPDLLLRNFNVYPRQLGANIVYPEIGRAHV